MALSGILSNIIIIKVYTAADLGIYNLSYAFFVILSQLSCFGVHLSCLRFLSVEDEKNRSLIIFSGMLLVFFISLVVSLVFYFLILQFIHAFGDSDLSKSLKLISLALIFYALNKVLMFSANGMRKMTLFASMQAARDFFVDIHWQRSNH